MNLDVKAEKVALRIEYMIQSMILEHFQEEHTSGYGFSGIDRRELRSNLADSLKALWTND